MGHKKRQRADVEEILARAWCYYCERDFEDLKLLISHQKAKHFKCDRCGRRLNTAGGLSVHMNQVHKETLTQVENALPNRQGLDVEIFGMEGIPADILEQHRTRIVQNFYQAQEDRRIATGNVQPHGAQDAASNPPRKKLRAETADELKARLAEHRAKVQAQKAAIASGQVPGQEFSPTYPQQGQPPFPQAGYPSGVPAYPPPSSAYHQQQQQQQQQQPISALPARPTIPPPTGLPQRPSAWAPPGSTGTGTGDDIDQLIRMAEAGIKPPLPPSAAPRKDDEQAAAAAAAAAADKKAKRDKARMVYADADEVSPEERMAVFARYAFVEVGA